MNYINTIIGLYKRIDTSFCKLLPRDLNIIYLDYFYINYYYEEYHPHQNSSDKEKTILIS
jgi:hypothetical protein